MRPINHTYEGYGKVDKRAGSAHAIRAASKADKSSPLSASGVLNRSNDTQEEQVAAQDVIQQLLDSRISPSHLPDVHATFPTAEKYLQVISLRLKDRVRQIHVSGLNPREKESKFGGRVLLRDPQQRAQKGKVGAPVTECTECSLLWKHSVTLSNKWRRETSLFSEALTLALESLEKDVGEGESLREELRAKEATMAMLLSRIEDASNVDTASDLT